MVNLAHLNKRKFPASSLTDKSNIAGVVDSGFTFEGTEVPELANALGKWIKDRDGYYYWGGGLTEVSSPAERLPLISHTDSKDWGFIDFRIEELWKSSKGNDIRVVVLDSGLNYNLPDFKNKQGIVYYNAVNDSANATDCLDDADGHGTNCAGILCAQGNVLFGVAPEITLLVIKITNEKGERLPAAILNGLEKAIELRADVISLSFSIGKDDQYFADIYAKIKEAYQKDIAVVASAGDSGALNFPVDSYPASFPESLSIGGIDRTRRRSINSAKSNFLDLMAPGENLKSVFDTGERISGTSFSAPFAAGVVAILKAVAKNKNISLTNMELYDILKRSADINVAGNYNTVDFGWGILDPPAALSLINKKS
ncbi:MAG: S8 family serine peptidase [Bacteroidetes bacterium]|nr:S8 family serine peptidase [Bacteroidota bacterium]